ncbi:MAG: acyl--CoA ligase, partial [Proteobacteria bacterium]|nr:acyl--CoA ligase [Pseudomonadota bacterium]
MYSPYLIHEFIENSAEKFPDKIAFIHEDVRASYAEINYKANQLGLFLMNRGVTKGDRVVIVFENCLEYVVSYYGILKVGAAAVPLARDLKPDGLIPILNELAPKAIILSSRAERLLKAVDLSDIDIENLIVKRPKMDWREAQPKVFDWDDIVHDEIISNPDVTIDKSELASIIYTSGSTGTPKGVMLSHENIVSNTRSICSYLKLTENDIQMVVLPFFYVMGKSLLNTHFAAGGTVVVNNKFAYPAVVVQQMIDEGVTGFSGVPSSYAYLLHRSPLKKYRDRLTSLRYCSQAGGHMSGQIKKELRQALPNHTDIFVMYGATEASARLTYLEPENFDKKMGSIGKPIPGVGIRVLDSNGKDVDSGEQGELVASGPNIMQGYWKDADTTKKVLNQHGYYTGDLGYRDPDGYLFISGRKDNLLKVGGHRINPQEIEDVLMSSGLFFETAVIGLPDTILGTKLIALTSPLSRDCTENQIMKHCADRLPKYKLPAEVKMVRVL